MKKQLLVPTWFFIQDISVSIIDKCNYHVQIQSRIVPEHIMKSLRSKAWIMTYLFHLGDICSEYFLLWVWWSISKISVSVVNESNMILSFRCMNNTPTNQPKVVPERKIQARSINENQWGVVDTQTDDIMHQVSGWWSTHSNGKY